MKKIIQNNIESLLKDQFNISNVEVLRNKNIEHGEYSTNLAMKESRNLGMNPRELADKVVEVLSGSEIFDNVTVAGPGFINFNINKDLLIKETLNWFDSSYKANIGLSGKMHYEFVSANPTGWLHIGHARNAYVGDTYLRVAKYAGYDVYREYYINDAGVQIENLASSVFLRYQEAKGIAIDEEEITYGGQEITQFGVKLAEEGREINSSDEIKQEVLEHFLEEIKTTLNNMNVLPFDGWVSELSLYTDGWVDKSIEQLKASGNTYEEDGALFIKTEEHGDDKDRVIIKSNGEKTYLLADIANHIEKYKKHYDQYIDLWGMDHHGYVARVKASMELLGYDSSILHVDLINMVKIMKDGEELKMSKRAGTSLTINEVLEIMHPDLLRFFILSKAKEQNLIITVEDMEKEDSSNPYWYAQYAFARSTQLINKYVEQYGEVEASYSFETELDDYSMKLIKLMVDFNDRIEAIAISREPSGIVHYIKELAVAFHSFYGNVKVGDNKDLIRLVIAFRNQYKTLFDLLGIEPKESM